MLPSSSKKKIVITLNIDKTQGVTMKQSMSLRQPKLGSHITSSFPEVTLGVNPTSDVMLASITEGLYNIRSEMESKVQ